jgi:hypothetical protein
MEQGFPHRREYERDVRSLRRHRRLVAWSLGRTGIMRLRVGHSGVLSHRFRRGRIGGIFGIQPILG